MTIEEDSSLIDRSRTGDTSAYAQLYERHVGVALGVARQIADRDAEDVVADAFTKTFTVLREGGGPEVAFRPYLLRAVRNAAIDRFRRERRVTPVESLDEADSPLHQEHEVGDPVIGQLEQQLAGRAFRSLPERWQLVLWHTEIQGEGPSKVAPLLGITPRAVSQLAVRAREGLRTAWLSEHAAQVPAGHERVVELLAPSVRSSLGRRDRRALDEHLAACPDCRKVRDELVEVNATLGADLLPAALLGLAAMELGWPLPAGSPAAALTGAAGQTGAAATAGGGSSAAGSGAGAGTTAGAGAAGQSTAGAGQGVVAGTSGIAAHPVVAGVVAAALVGAGVGGYLLWDANRGSDDGRPPPAQDSLAPSSDTRSPADQPEEPEEPPAPEPPADDGSQDTVPTSDAPRQPGTGGTPEDTSSTGSSPTSTGSTSSTSTSASTSSSTTSQSQSSSRSGSRSGSSSSSTPSDSSGPSGSRDRAPHAGPAR